MNLRKFFSTLVLSFVLLVGFLTTAVHAAVTPDEAKGVIQDSGSMMEAAERLREADSTDKVRQQYKFDGETKVHTAQDPLAKTGEKLKETAETVKEKLNLDEPLPPSTKKFLGQEEK
jgi:pyruvate dehydrogenase complex dehydrogenase (E1) component